MTLLYSHIVDLVRNAQRRSTIPRFVRGTPWKLALQSVYGLRRRSADYPNVLTETPASALKLCKGMGHEFLHDNGLQDCIEKGTHGGYTTTRTFDEGTVAGRQLESYGTFIFWKQLRRRLALRDTYERVPYVDFDRRDEFCEWDRIVTCLEYRYLEEFNQNGIDNVRVVRQFP